MSQIHKFFIEHALYPAMEHLKGNHIRRITAELQETQKSGAPELQRQRLARLLKDCRDHVPAYENAITAGDAEIDKDPYRILQTQVSPLKKSVFQKNGKQYLSDRIPESMRIANCTGGSTGQPTHFFMTKNQVQTYEAARWRGLSWFGITPGSRSVMLWGNPIELSRKDQARYQAKERFLKNRVILSAYSLTEKHAKSHVEFINKYRPEYLYGYAGILTAFARIMDAQGLRLSVPLKAVVSTSETLENRQRDLLQRVFGCPVANEYGARDAGILAYTCPENGHLHITAENCLIEILDPITLKPLPPGNSGLIAVTDLNNEVQPRLRWLLGDVGTLSETPCPCGRGLPVLKKVEGREDALLLRTDEILVHGNVITQILRADKNIRTFRFRQLSPEEAALSIVKAEGTAIDEQALQSQIAGVLPGTKIHIEYTDEIPPSASGKIRTIIREFSLPNEK